MKKAIFTPSTNIHAPNKIVDKNEVTSWVPSPKNLSLACSLASERTLLASQRPIVLLHAAQWTPETLFAGAGVLFKEKRLLLWMVIIWWMQPTEVEELLVVHLIIWLVVTSLWFISKTLSAQVAPPVGRNPKASGPSLWTRPGRPLWSNDGFRVEITSRNHEHSWHEADTVRNTLKLHEISSSHYHKAIIKQWINYNKLLNHSKVTIMPPKKLLVGHHTNLVHNSWSQSPSASKHMGSSNWRTSELCYFPVVELLCFFYFIAKHEKHALEQMLSKGGFLEAFGMLRNDVSVVYVVAW